MEKPLNVDDYISRFPEETQMLLEELRLTIKKAAPDAVEVISYSMPAFKLNRMLAWYAGYEKHIGFYPGSSGIAMFKKEISIYKNAKGSVQFPLNKKLPLALITRIVKFKMKQNSEKAKSKTIKKKVN